MILDDGMEEAITMIMRRVEWFGHVDRRDESENMTAETNVAMEEH